MGLAASKQEAFWEACGFGHLDRARYFLEQGDIDVNWVSYVNDCCPIHTASQGKPEIVDLLLEHNCDVNVRDSRGNLALHHAAMKGHVDIVQTLLQAGSHINDQEKNGWTALHNAAYWCHPDVVSVLIKNGCDVNIQNKDMRTALHECARSQQQDDEKLAEIAQTLIDAGSDVNAKSSDLGEADLTGLMYASYHNHPEVASILIQAGCELDSIGTTFWTALHWAADRGHDELVYILLEAGADPTKKGMRGETALDRAKSSHIRETLVTAMELQRELHKVNLAEKRSQIFAVKKMIPEFEPKCDAKFKSQSFLPSDWKPSNSVNVKNLINEKKSRLAAMTSQNYRKELARRTGATNVIEDTEKSKNAISKLSIGDEKKPDNNVCDEENLTLKDAVEAYENIGNECNLNELKKLEKDVDKKEIENNKTENEKERATCDLGLKIENNNSKVNVKRESGEMTDCLDNVEAANNIESEENTE